MTITIVESSVLKVVAEKDVDQNWVVLGRALAVRNIPRFSNVANIVTRLANHGSVGIVDSEGNPKPHYKISQYGLNLIKE